ncbi:MAG: flagellar protein FlaG [Candidatus Zixiibacteriota bacterium]
MNYDLFIPPAVVEAMHLTLPSAGTSRTGQQARPAIPEGAVAAPFGTEQADAGSRNLASDPPHFGDVEGAVGDFNAAFELANVGVRYRVDDGTGDLVVALVDRETDEVLRQFPPDEILRMRQRLQELQGILFDQTA